MTKNGILPKWDCTAHLHHIAFPGTARPGKCGATVRCLGSSTRFVRRLFDLNRDLTLEHGFLLLFYLVPRDVCVPSMPESEKLHSLPAGVPSSFPNHK
jgi:hypothetical protein